VVQDPAKNRHEARMMARRYKTHPPKGYDYTIWVDSNCQLKVNPIRVVRGVGKADIMVHRHKFRNNIVEEAQAVIKLKGIPRRVVSKQLQIYRKEGFEAQVPLPETGVLVRRSGDVIDAFNKLWWQQISSLCVRDQMSFGYCAWKTGISIQWFPFNIQDDKIVRLRTHGS
jgi:hypothetical protein